jgi:hypothetical protein
VSVAPAPTITLSRRFAGELGEMTLPSRAAAAPAPHLLVLNEPLAVELGVDPDWLRRAHHCGHRPKSRHIQ